MTGGACMDERPRNTGPRKFLSLRLGITGLLSAAGAVAAGATVAGFGERLWWRFDLFAHFRPQYAAGLVVVATVMIFRRRRKTAAAFALLAIVNVVLILAAVVGRNVPPHGDAATFTLLVVNVYTENTDHAAVIDFVRSESPDFVILEEVNDGWLAALEALGDSYPHMEARPREDNFGMALLSRRPFLEAAIEDTAAGVPTIMAVSEISGKHVTVFALHTLPPGGARYWRLRNRMLDGAARQAASIRGPLVLAGDLNTTPWTFTFHRFVKTSGLRDAGAGRWPFGTWPANLLPLRIPIDHVLHSVDLAVVSRRRGPDIGSDHFPTVIEFALVE